MTEISNGESKEVKALKINLDITKGFLDIVKKIDSLPELKKTTYTQTRSLYQAVSKGREIQAMEQELETFFGPPVKPAGKPLPFLLRFNPSIKYLDGIREEQVLFIKKVKAGFYYGALWPWRRDPQQITVHLGFCSHKMSDKDFRKLEELVKSKVLHEKVFEELDSGVGGQVQGISLASFLQMAAMEKITCTLKIKTHEDIGYLHLLKGNLISAETGQLKNRKAAYKIISWTNSIIDIEKPSGKKEDEIKQSVVNILMAALKLREKEELRQKELPDDGIIDLVEPIPLEVEAEPTPVEKPDKKRLVKLGAMAGIVVLILALGTVLALRYMKSKRVEAEYQSALSRAENQQGVNAKISILQSFIDSNEPGELTQNAQAKIQEIRKRFEEQDFKAAMNQADTLTKSNDYEKLAAIYQEYLRKHPRGIHTGIIRNKSKELSLLIESKDYNELVQAAQSSNVERIYSYFKYLEKHPQGAHRDRVRELIANMFSEYYQYFNRKITACTNQEDWDQCIRHCNTFTSIYPKHQKTDEIRDMTVLFQTKLQEQQTLAELKQQAQNMGSDYRAGMQIYFDYLNSHPDTVLKNRIIEEISALKKQEAQKQLQDETAKIVAAVQESGGRFVDNRDGTITDKTTGLMWSLLDSQLDHRKCLNYEAAGKYVKELRTGGYKDWRLPTQKELTGIYKTKPFFPEREARWYWTSKSYSRYSGGWQTMVQIVTTARETEWGDDQADASECGAVQAVRP